MKRLTSSYHYAYHNFQHLYPYALLSLLLLYLFFPSYYFCCLYFSLLLLHTSGSQLGLSWFPAGTEFAPRRHWVVTERWCSGWRQGCCSIAYSTHSSSLQQNYLGLNAIHVKVEKHCSKQIAQAPLQVLGQLVPCSFKDISYLLSCRVYFPFSLGASYQHANMLSFFHLNKDPSLSRPHFPFQLLPIFLFNFLKT